MKSSKNATKVEVWWKILMRASKVVGGPLENKINLTNQNKEVFIFIDGLPDSYHFHGSKMANTWLILKYQGSHKSLVTKKGDGELILSSVDAAIGDAENRKATLMTAALGTLKEQWNGPRTKDRDISHKEEELRKRHAVKTKKRFEDQARRRAEKETEKQEHQRAKTIDVKAAEEEEAILKKRRQENEAKFVKEQASVQRRHDEDVQSKSSGAAVIAQEGVSNQINAVIKAPAPERDYRVGCSTAEEEKEHYEKGRAFLASRDRFNKEKKAREGARADYAPGGPQGKHYPPFPSPPMSSTEMDLHQWASHIAELNIHIQEHGVPSVKLLNEAVRVEQNRDLPPFLKYDKDGQIFRMSRHLQSVKRRGLPRHYDFDSMDELVENYQEFKSNRLPKKDRVLQQNSGIGPGACVRLRPHPVLALEESEKLRLRKSGVTTDEGVVLEWIPPEKDQKQCGCWAIRLGCNDKEYFRFRTARLEVLQRPLAVDEKMRVQALPGVYGVLKGKEVTVIGWWFDVGLNSSGCGWNVSMTIAGQEKKVLIKNSPDGRPTLVPSLPPSEDAAAKQWKNRYSLFPGVTPLVALMNGATGEEKKKIKKKLKRQVKKLRDAEEKKQDEIIAVCLGLEAPKPCATFLRAR